MTRRRVLSVGLGILVIGINVGTWFGVAGWRKDVSDLRAEAENLGAEIASLRAEAQALAEAQVVITRQIDDGANRIEELATESEPILARADRAMDIAARLDACATERAALINALWVRPASDLTDQEAAIDERCSTALNDLETLLPGGIMP